MNESLWIFGYGSIIWKTGFDYDESRLAYLPDRARRFWQASTDHRGTIASPGRVVTLIDQPGESCWGLAFKVPSASVELTLSNLDVREIGGYERESVTIHFPDKDPVRGLTYTAHPANPNYLGPASAVDIASQIASSEGPSGSNNEYVFELALALDNLQVEDPHIQDIAGLLKERTDTENAP